MNDNDRELFYKKLRLEKIEWEKNLDKIYDIIDSNLSELKPNYGYVEKYNIADKILKLNNYLLANDNEKIIELMYIVLNEKKS